MRVGSSISPYSILWDEDGNPIWPAPKDQMTQAREIIREFANANKKTLICPDKNTDGPTSETVLHRTVNALGLSPTSSRFTSLKKAPSSTMKQSVAESPQNSPTISSHFRPWSHRCAPYLRPSPSPFRDCDAPGWPSAEPQVGCCASGQGRLFVVGL